MDRRLTYVTVVIKKEEGIKENGGDKIKVFSEFSLDRIQTIELKRGDTNIDLTRNVCRFVDSVQINIDVDVSIDKDLTYNCYDNDMHLLFTFDVCSNNLSPIENHRFIDGIGYSFRIYCFENNFLFSKDF